MHEIIYLKSFYEPWWMLEGWEQDIVLRKPFSSIEEANRFKSELMDMLSAKYPEHKKKGETFDVYWEKGDLEYCPDCEEDLQVYHGVIHLNNEG
ncbi:MAG TPA: DUF1033 family protein [Planococcus sp. (in: firmicutes)]|nr:DUF1033 family protein [Planococcus sp. (in: firmicutes)]